MSDDRFEEELVSYFRYSIKNSLRSRHTDQRELVERSWNHFEQQLGVEENEDIYLEVLFSLFEIFPLTSPILIWKVLENFVLRKLDRFSYLKTELTQDLPLRLSPDCYIHYYLDPLEAERRSVDSFCSPTLLLDLSAVVRLLRYGSRFEMTPLQNRYCLTSILGCLT
jgi:hypothetical protein